MVAAMGCCEATNPDLLGAVQGAGQPGARGTSPRPAAGEPWDRRTTLKSLAAVAGVVAVSGCGSDVPDGATRVRLAFCGPASVRRSL